MLESLLRPLREEARHHVEYVEDMDDQNSSNMNNNRRETDAWPEL